MELQKFKNKFVGPYKIKEIKLLKEKTYLGKPKVWLKYESDKEEELPLEALEEIVVKEKSDLTELREKRVKSVVQRILILLVESEMSLADIDYAVGPKLRMSIQDSLNRAQEKMWGKIKENINLMDVEKILRKK